MINTRLYKLKDDLNQLDFNVLTVVNEGLQRLIIDAFTINATCTE